MTTASAIIMGTPAWVWGILTLIVYLGLSALRPSSKTPLRLSLVPGIFLTVAIGTLLNASRLLDVIPLWIAGCVFGVGTGAVWAMVLQIGIAKAEGLIRMPGTAFWLVTGLIVFGMRYALEVYSVFNRELAQEPFWISLPYGIAGLGTGMSIGWWAVLMMRYFRAAGP